MRDGDEMFKNILIIVVSVVVIGVIGLWYWRHPRLEYGEIEATCSDCVYHNSEGHCSSWQNYPCKKTQCLRRK